MKFEQPTVGEPEKEPSEEEGVDQSISESDPSPEQREPSDQEAKPTEETTYNNDHEESYGNEAENKAAMMEELKEGLKNGGVEIIPSEDEENR